MWMSVSGLHLPLCTLCSSCVAPVEVTLNGLTVSGSLGRNMHTCDLLENSGDAPPVLHLTKEQLVASLLVVAPLVPTPLTLLGDTTNPLALLQERHKVTCGLQIDPHATNQESTRQPEEGANDLWPPPEKHSLRRLFSLIPPFATELLHRSD